MLKCVSLKISLVLSMMLVWFLSTSSARAQTDDENAVQSSGPTLTWDLGFSGGNYLGVSYSEINLGVNYYFKEWLIWRNAIFGRFATGYDTLTGLDSSLRGVWRAELGRHAGIGFFGGPGYRFVNRGPNAPFLEGGITFRLFGLALGGGAKLLLNSMVSNQQNDTQFFIILSGGGTL